ncbi:Uncharacterised protein [Legionella wadsworthii]|uniref:Uncharacterized protein n=1 Tax=Legionella wadsworthii TaxID=28088 RepID=A0A378LSF7_9GAMM|nr:Uncharacterised protein [Legionella wadsworthii]
MHGAAYLRFSAAEFAESVLGEIRAYQIAAICPK